MNLISTTKVLLQNDRNGLFEEFIQIEVNYVPESDVKRYRFDVKDFALLNKDLENESKQSIYDRNGGEVRRTYYKTYAEFDGMVEQLKQLFPSELTGSELQDFLVAQGSLLQLQQEPIYGVEFIAR